MKTSITAGNGDSKFFIASHCRHWDQHMQVDGNLLPLDYGELGAVFTP